MALLPIEREILAELRHITGRKKLKEKDLLEWSTDQSILAGNLRDGEVMVHCPLSQVWAAIPKE